jgi:hypothetical protein
LARPVFFAAGTDERLAGGFTQMPNAVLRSPSLSSGAKVLYGVLLSYAQHTGACCPDQETLGRDMGLSSRQVRQHLRELEDAQLIRVHRRGLNMPNVYEILPLWDASASPNA